MILPSPELILATAAALAALWCAIAIMSGRARLSAEKKALQQSLEEELQKCRLECRQTVDEALREFHIVAPPESSGSDASRDSGRLSRSARTRALRMLRAGASAEKAALELELPRKDVQLLSRVATVLAQ